MNGELDGLTECVTCPACLTFQPADECTLGALRNREHYRCRACGMQWSDTLTKGDGPCA